MITLNIENILDKYIDIRYKEFHKKICQTRYEILGIKIPILRKVAKDLLKKHSYQEILNTLNDRYYEHIMLEGLIIANAKIEYDTRINLITNFLAKIDNWAICDIFCGDLKFIKNYKEDFLKYTLPLLNDIREFYKRFAIVILLIYYINDHYIDLVLEKMLDIKSDYYYVKMATSWCLSICLIKYFDKTIKFMKENKDKIDIWTYNKALQKGKESFRISKENKEILEKMKRK